MAFVEILDSLLRNFCKFGNNAYVRGLRVFFMWTIFRSVYAGGNSWKGSVLCL